MEPILNAANNGSSDIDVDALISHITRLLAAIKTSYNEKNRSHTKRSAWQWPTSSAFSRLREFVETGSNVSAENDSFSKLSGEAKTVAMSILKGIGGTHWAAAGLLVVSRILERFESMSANNTECMQVLEAMNRLALHIKQLKDRANLKEGMDDMIQEAVCMIVHGSILCYIQMNSSKFSKFFWATMNGQELLDLRSNLDDMYKRLMLQMGICIYDAINNRKTALPRQKAYPDHAVGIEEQFYKVIQLLELESENNAVAVILHGFGGMGKTTLADAVFARLEMKGCKFSTVRLFENTESVPDITKLQTWILQDLTEPNESVPEDIRRFEDGQRLLRDILEKEQAFIYIDNVLKKDQLQKLLPKKLLNSKKLRLLLTARNEYVKDVLKLCGIKTCIYSVEPLIPEAAKELLCGKSDVIASDEMQLKMIEICKGIPLMLDVVGGYLFSSQNKDEAYRKIIEWRDSGKAFSVEEDNLETNGLNFAFEKLPESLKDPFHDICSFFTGWDWDEVAAIVGEEELCSLKNRALLRKEEKNNKVNVHDVIHRIGLNQTMGKRFTTDDGLLEALKDNKQKIRGIKGIWFHRQRPSKPFLIPAAKLDSMHNSLRVLHLDSIAVVDGKCNEKFEQLRYFYTKDCSNNPFEISRLKELRFLSYAYDQKKTLDLSQASPLFSSQLMPSKLRLLNLLAYHDIGSSSPYIITGEITGEAIRNLPDLLSLTWEPFQLTKLPEEISSWTKLKKLRLAPCSIERIPQGLGKLNALRQLSLQQLHLKELPETLGNLQSLRELDLSWSSRLEALPEMLGNLSSLQKLTLTGCSRLKRLPSNLGSCISLEELELYGCESLKELPDGLENLKSLVNLNLKGCKNLKSIPNSFGQLISLAASIDMEDCKNLTELCEGFCNLTFIKDISLRCCFALHKLPESFKKLIHLRKVNLVYCTSLLRLPKGFHELVSLEELDLSECKSLEDLCDDFHRLASLQYLEMRDCEKLKGKWMESVVKIKTLEFVGIKKSEMLVERWQELEATGGSWQMAVRTGQHSENVDKILNKLACRFFTDNWGLIDCDGELFRASTLRCNTVLLFVKDSSIQRWWRWEEIFKDQLSYNIQIIYIGQYFDEMPLILKKRTLAYAFSNSLVHKFFDRAVSILGHHRSINKNSQYSITTNVEEDKEGRKHFSSWKDLSKGDSLRKFVLSKSETYLRLKHLVETRSVEVQESNIKLLRALLETDSEEKDFVLVKNNADHKVNVEDLQGKLVLLYISDYYFHPKSLLTEMYVEFHDQYGFEIVSIPLDINIHMWSDFQKIVNNVPWPVISNPWSMKPASLYFIEEEWRCSPNTILVVVEPNGKISNKNALPMVERFGALAYPFTLSREHDLKVAEWN
eukprot:Gb_36230 [translate_table: standard]